MPVFAAVAVGAATYLLEQHPREVPVAAVLVGAQRCADLLFVDLVVDVEVLGRRVAPQVCSARNESGSYTKVRTIVRPASRCIS